MAAISLKNYAFRYAGEELPTLRSVTMTVPRGERWLLCGKTGSGKSTLLRCLKRELRPEGQETGEMEILDAPPATGVTPTAFRVGFVFQQPDVQTVTDSVWHELAFGLENMGLPAAEIRRRTAEIASFFGMEDWLQRRVSTLSGGQKQTLALASVLVMQPELLLLDEPTAQLDPIAAREFLQTLWRVNTELGVTVLLSEHRTEEVLPYVDRVCELKNGEARVWNSPQEFARAAFAEDAAGAVLPAVTRLAYRLGEREQYPLCVRDGREWLEAHRSLSLTARDLPSKTFPKRPLLQADEVWFRYEREQAWVLRGASLSLYAGEIHALCGGNGSGKSTLLRLLADVDRPQKGRVRGTGARTVLLPQRLRALLTRDTVEEELLEYTACGYSEAEARAMAERLGLTALWKRHPYDLSGGEMQKTALAKVLLLSPSILLLDEPVKGLDAAAREELRGLLRALADDGKTVLFVTHDLEFAARTADRVSLMMAGDVVCTADSRSFFEQNLWYTTTVSRMLRGRAKRCVTVEDVVCTRERLG